MTLRKIAKWFLAVALIWVLAAGVFYSGFYFGTLKPKVVIVEGIKGIEDGAAAADFGVFWEAWEIIKKNYYRADDVYDKRLIYGAVSGLLDSLDDPHSVFFNPEEYKKFSEDINGSFSGIGAEIGIRNKQLIIVSPLKNTPAEAAGLRSGDKILKINEILTNNLTVEEAVALIRGEKGTKVDLTILRDVWEEPKVVSIIREEIVIPSVELKMLALSEAEGKNIAYIQIYNFSENLPLVFYRTAVKAASAGTRGVILDLRNNPGGFLEASVNVAGWFLDKGDIVVKERFRSGDVSAFRASGNGAFKNVPLVVLVNQGSASASEILAGALRDNRGVKLVGETTFGKGTIQELKELSGGESIKISVAEWLLPNGDAIEKKGLSPDYEVPFNEEDIKTGRDPQLDKAVEVLKELL